MHTIGAQADLAYAGAHNPIISPTMSRSHYLANHVRAGHMIALLRMSSYALLAPNANPLTHTLSLALSLYLSFLPQALIPAPFPTHSLSLIHSLTHTHTRSLSLSLSLASSRWLLLALFCPGSVSFAISFSYCLSLSRALCFLLSLLLT